MIRRTPIYFFMAWLVTMLTAPLAAAQPIPRARIASLLGFEAEHSGGRPRGWVGGPFETIFLDEKVVHSGKWSVRLERPDSGQPGFTTITMATPLDFQGTRIELRGFIRTEAVRDWVGLWLREDGDTGQAAFDNMQDRKIGGTREWTEYSIVLPLRPEAKTLVFGFLLSGPGRAWVDDMQLLVDGKPIAEAPAAKRELTVLDKDHEFDGGSGVAINGLSPTQVENLAILGRIWGFLKYHHPAVTGGQRNWDYELFRVLPQVLAVSDHAAAIAAIVAWVDRMGPVEPCKDCATLVNADLHLRPELDWIGDEQLLGADLSGRLKLAYRNRHAKGPQFYVSQTPNVQNPIFDHEQAYAELAAGDYGFQLLGLFRFWNIIEYWFPDRDVIGEKWADVLTEFVPRIASAKTKAAYQLEMTALIARVHDTHANLSGPLTVRPPVGECNLPVVLQLVEQRVAVTGYSHPEKGPATGLKVGDEILALDGTTVEELVKRWAPYYGASNDAALFRAITGSMTRGACGKVTLQIARGKETSTIATERIAERREGSTWHDRSGEAFQKLAPHVAYLKLSGVKIADVPKYLAAAEGSKGWIIDIRNYPSEFVVFALGSIFASKETPFARFTRGDLSNPGAFHWSEPTSLQPGQKHYDGKIVVLVDEVSVSQAEYTTMAFRAAGATVIGSTTAGADGNVSQIPLPGGLRSMMSGIGVFYPDKKPTQRVGIVPDVVKRPTIAGIRAGRDEVLEEGLRLILGPDVSQAEIEAMAKK